MLTPVTTSLVVIRGILDILPAIERIHVVEFPRKPVLQERFQLTSGEEEQITRALRIREELGLQFWDALLLTYLSTSNASERFLGQAKAHNSLSAAVSLSSRGGEFESFISERPGANIAFLSKVLLGDGSERHLPLLDFHCPNNDSNLALAISVLKQIEIGSGFLLESGDSYHFYGSRLLTPDEHVQFMGTALHFSPIIDRVWIAHQLRELMAALRITPKHGITPYVVAEIDEPYRV